MTAHTRFHLAVLSCFLGVVFLHDFIVCRKPAAFIRTIYLIMCLWFKLDIAVLPRTRFHSASTSRGSIRIDPGLFLSSFQHRWRKGQNLQCHESILKGRSGNSPNSAFSCTILIQLRTRWTYSFLASSGKVT